VREERVEWRVSGFDCPVELREYNDEEANQVEQEVQKFKSNTQNVENR
jgi:hypothetical protein